MDFYIVCAKIQELLIKNESVTLPGTGKFIIESFPAAFLEDGKTIVPPSKKLRFIPLTEDQAKDSVAREQEAELVELSGRIREALVQNGKFEVPGFGVFADNGSGEVTFTIAEEFDFAPDNFALESISLEENEPAAPEAPEVSELPAQETAPKGTEQKVTGQKEAELKEKEQEGHDVAARKETLRKWTMWTIVVLVSIAVVVLFLILFKEDVKGLLQNLLYTKEELEIMEKWAAQ